jgi:3-phosphoshikimate 1-carboxyvinyltransferase
VTLEKVNINDNLNLSNNENGNSKQSPQLITHDRKPITLNLQLKYDLNKAPDIAQTIAVTCFGLGIGCYLTGLHTLKIKETDRLEALKNELEKLDAVVTISADSIVVEPRSLIRENIKIKTYQDHRMAMAFAPLALKTSLIIEDAEVVSKSYPSFWTDLKSIGFKIDETTAL